MDALESPAIGMLEERKQTLELSVEEALMHIEVQDQKKQEEFTIADKNDMIEMHLSETLKAGPITKFSGINVIKMFGDNQRL